MATPRPAGLGAASIPHENPRAALGAKADPAEAPVQARSDARPDDSAALHLGK